MVTKESKNGREIFVAIDSNSIVHRAFHSYPESLETSSGVQVNAVFGFTTMFLKVLDLFKPKYILCAFDTPKPTHRHVKYAAYKGTRKPTDKSLIAQFPIVEDIVTSFNIPILKKEGYEADDILGTLAEFVKNGRWANENVHLCIVSGDNDLLQLVDERVSVILPQGNFRNLKEFDVNAVVEKYDIYPKQLEDYKAIVGDVSDNIPGVKGIGHKGASELIKEHGSLDGVYANLNSLKPRIKTLLEESVDQVSLSKELVAIYKDMDLDIKLESCLQKDFDVSVVKEKFVEFEFKSLINKVPVSIAQEKKSSSGDEQFGLFGQEPKKTFSDNGFDLEALRASLKGAKEITGVFLQADEVVSKKNWIIFGGVDNLGKDFLFSSSFEKSQDVVAKIFEEPLDCEIIVYGFEDFVANLGCLVSVDGVFDIKLLSHIANSGLRDYSLSNLAFVYLGKYLPEKIDPADSSKTLNFVKEILEKIVEELSGREISEDLLGKKVKFLEYSSNLENSLSIVLALMEKRGILVDEDLLNNLHFELDKNVKNLVKEIYECVGHEFNINSTKQLSDILFNELGLPTFAKTKTLFSTKEEVLKKLEHSHPVVSKILEYRQKTKLMNNYVKAYRVGVATKKKRGEELSIHTDFKQTGTTSGRLSSVNPNMQNLPVAGELSEKLREIFIPRKGFVFLSADYSQIDLRVMAHLSQDEKLIGDFEKEKDIHLSTASRILDKVEGDITSAERKIGKTINFGIIYGLTAYGLSQSLKISVSKAEEYINEYFENYSGVREYINNMTKEVQNTRYVRTILGRQRNMLGINSRNLRVQNAAIREAINMPVQGGSADVMKIAMVEIFKMISEKYKDNAFMILQIHDEIVFEIKEELVKSFEDDVKKIMVGCVSLKVPLGVNIVVGKNIAELK